MRGGDVIQEKNIAWRIFQPRMLISMNELGPAHRGFPTCMYYIPRIFGQWVAASAVVADQGSALADLAPQVAGEGTADEPNQYGGGEQGGGSRRRTAVARQAQAEPYLGGSYSPGIIRM